MSQQKELTYKEKFNFLHYLFVIHQRGLVVTSRKHWGTQALGFPCFFAFILMALWFVATHDQFLLYWLGYWLLCLAMRRIEAVKNYAKVHSYYDGWPINLCSNETLAKLVLEPLLFGILGGFLFWFYLENDWSPTGLPYFLLAGCISLPFVEGVKQTVWNRRLQTMRDARMESEAALKEFQNRFGN